MTRFRGWTGWLGAAVIGLGLSISMGPAVQAQTGAVAGETGPSKEEILSRFDSWKRDFRVRALGAGITAATFDTAFEGVEPIARVIERDQSQPEFVRPIWDYMDGAVSDARVQKGREMLARHRKTLTAMERRYGVPPQVVVAIWGLESSYGAIKGSTDVIAALSTLAIEGRRQRFAERELIAAMRILQDGDITREGLTGSWAGAMGHTQFIPSNVLAYGVDANRDGRRDLWESLPDVFASTANYLKEHDWQEGYRWGREVRLPDGFEYALAERGVTKSLRQWRDLGVRRPGGGALPVADIEASIILPAGHAGPAFLVYDNFRVIMRYNNATSYALAIGHLSDRIAGRGPISGDWPRHERPLKRSERVELQERLTRAGYALGEADGVIGRRTRAAVRAFQTANGLPADGFATASLLDAVRRATGDEQR